MVECAEAVTATAADMAARFGAGGRLIAFGNGAGSTDAQHIAVEFIDPVIYHVLWELTQQALRE